MPIEYKRTCKVCGKIWCSQVSREEKLSKEKRKENIRSGLSTLQTNWSAAAQERKNAQTLEQESTTRKQCPDCNSANYKEEIIGDAEFSDQQPIAAYRDNKFAVTQSMTDDGENSLLVINLVVDRSIQKFPKTEVNSRLFESFKTQYDITPIIGRCKYEMNDNGFKIKGFLRGETAYELETDVTVVVEFHKVKVTTKVYMKKKSLWAALTMSFHSKQVHALTHHLIFKHFAKTNYGVELADSPQTR